MSKDSGTDSRPLHVTFNADHSVRACPVSVCALDC